MGESFYCVFCLTSLTKCQLLIPFFPPLFPGLRVALETLDRLTESLDFTDYASRIIHPIVRTLDSTPELRSTSMDTLSSLVFQLGKKVAAVWGPVLRAWRGDGGVSWSRSYYTEDFPHRPPYCWPHSSRFFGNATPLFPQQVIITSCQTADVIWCLAVGGSCLWGVDEVIHPPPLSKPLQRRPCSLLSFSFKRVPLTSETAALRAATANVQALLLISGP